MIIIDFAILPHSETNNVGVVKVKGRQSTFSSVQYAKQTGCLDVPTSINVGTAEFVVGYKEYRVDQD